MLAKSNQSTATVGIFWFVMALAWGDVLSEVTSVESNWKESRTTVDGSCQTGTIDIRTTAAQTTVAEEISVRTTLCKKKQQKEF